jgi:hypothetical protein
MRIASIILGLALVLTTVGGCQSNSVNIVDLNKVLDIFQATLNELDGKDVAAAKADGEDGEAKKEEVVGIEVVKEEDKAKQEEFVALFRTKLNAAKVSSTPVGVMMHESGAIKGFADTDNDKVKDANEKELFTIEIDEARNRVIASDGGGHYRDHRYRGGGFFTGYMIGSMMGRNRNYYSGSRAGLKPDYGKTTMSSKNYHSAAVSKAKAAARSSSARSRSGSRGMSFGK